MAPQLLMVDSRVPEELHDVRNDPFEMHNLVGNLAHAATLKRLRGAFASWRRAYGDKGEMTELEMAQQMGPNGGQPQTEAPFMVPINAEQPGLETSGGGSYHAPLLQLSCDTQGASIGYKLNGDDNRRLYGGPLHLRAGETTVTSKAIRVGHEEGTETVARFVVEDA